jgi:hypothetical protein
MNLPPNELNFRYLANHDPDPRPRTGTIPILCDYGPTRVAVLGA